MIPSAAGLAAGILAASVLSALLAALHGAATEIGLQRLRHRARTAENGATTQGLQDGYGSRQGAPGAWVPEPDRMVLLLLIVNPLAKIVAIVLWTEFLRRVYPGASWPATFAITVFGMGLFLVLVADALPRSFGRSHAEGTIRLLSGPFRVLTLPLAPLALGLVRLRQVLHRGPPDTAAAASRAEEELRVIVESTEGSHPLPHEERRMLRGVIDFSDRVIREVMTPRIDIVAIEDTEPPERLVRIVSTSGLSRIPVYHETIDQVTGVIVARDLFEPLSRGSLEDWTQLARPALFVPETSPVPVVLGELRRQKTHLAIVVDEYGGTAGLVTVEDLIEEIVGEIEDEHDQAAAAPIHRDPSGAILVEARCPIDDAREQLGLDLPEEEDYDTIGGYVYRTLGRIPRPGEHVDVGSSRITVESGDSRRIHRLRIVPLETPSPENRA